MRPGVWPRPLDGRGLRRLMSPINTPRTTVGAPRPGGTFVEFGIFLNGYIPGPAAHDTWSEHTALMRETEYTILADQHNWKYAWFGEHHSLTEYSHLSASEVVIGYCAHATERIHL